MASEVIDHADRIIVNSAFAAELVALEGGGGRTIVLPMAAPGTRSRLSVAASALRERYGIAKEAPIVLSLGEIDERRCIPALFEAVAGSSQLAEATVVLTGNWSDAIEQQVRGRAASLGLTDRLVFARAPAEPDIDRWLDAATCAVHTAYPTNGESSFDLMRCLAAGVPTIVNDHGSARELPDEVVLKIAAQPQPAELGSAIASLLSDEALTNRLADGARSHARDLSFERVADRLWQEVISAS